MWVLAFCLLSNDSLQEVMDRDRLFSESVSTRQHELFASLIHENATFIGGSLLKGHEAVVNGWAALLAVDRATELTWSPKTGESSGDLAYTIGDYLMLQKVPEGEPTRLEGEYLSVWKRTGGEWQVIADGSHIQRIEGVSVVIESDRVSLKSPKISSSETVQIQTAQGSELGFAVGSYQATENEMDAHFMVILVAAESGWQVRELCLP